MSGDPRGPPPTTHARVGLAEALNALPEKAHRAVMDAFSAMDPASRPCFSPPKGATRLINVRVTILREHGYGSLKEWLANPKHVYIGRANSEAERSPFHNPFKVGAFTTREAAVEMYRDYITDKLKKEPKLRRQLRALKGKTLGCWCAPEPCHGDVLLELIAEAFSIDT